MVDWWVDLWAVIHGWPTVILLIGPGHPCRRSANGCQCKCYGRIIQIHALVPFTFKCMCRSHKYIWIVYIWIVYTYDQRLYQVLISFDQESMAELSLSRYMAHTRHILPLQTFCQINWKAVQSNHSALTQLWNNTCVWKSQPCALLSEISQCWSTRSQEVNTEMYPNLLKL